VTSTFQVKIGIRNMVMPAPACDNRGDEVTPDRIVPRPDSTRPMIHMSAPIPGEYTWLVSGE